MIEIGRFNRLPAMQMTKAGLLLGDEDDRILLPNAKIPHGTQPGDILKVFVYTDSQDRPIATTETPKAVVGDFALLEVIDTSRHGAFLDWGLDKDLIVPTREQHTPLRTGDKAVVFVMLDRDERVMATAKLAPHFDKRVRGLQVGKAVSYLVYGHSERGIRCAVDGRYSGLLFRDQTFRKLRIGDEGRAWITEIRPDGRLDLSLQSPGRSASDDARSVLIAAIKADGGFLPLTDKSDPQLISQRLQMSKKAFKRAVGGLYKERKIEILEKGIRWIGT